jgi:hypothetical protein
VALFSRRDILAERNDVHPTGFWPGGSCVSDFAGSFTRLELFGRVRLLGDSIYCGNSGQGNPAIRPYLPGTQWSHVGAMRRTNV